MIFTNAILPCVVLLQAVTASPASLSQPRGNAVSVAQLRRISKTGGSTKALLSKKDLTAPQSLLKRRNGSASLDVFNEGAGYSIDIGFGGQNFTVVFDTGSSDLWLPKTGFQCLSSSGANTSLSSCHFPSSAFYKGSFNGGQIADENFLIAYANGEFLNGVLGYEDVTIAEITVGDQEVALVERGYYESEGSTDGILGFAYSALTSAFHGTNVSNDGPNNTAHYSNFLNTAIHKGLIDPIFSLILEETDTGGSGELTLGGFPNGTSNTTFVSTSLVTTSLVSTNYSYYAIIPDGFLLTPANGGNETFIPYNEQNTGSFTNTSQSGNGSQVSPVVVDSGTSLIYLPISVVEQVNSAFDPPGGPLSGGLYFNDCIAKPPTFAVRINGTDFYIDSEQLLFGVGDGLCVLGVVAGDEPYILGDVFLKNVISVFDIGNSQMHFAAHESAMNVPPGLDPLGGL